MKAITKLTGILIALLFLASCATAPLKVADKYNLDNELTEATDITGSRIDSWESIDYQSLIIKANINDYYLIILNRPALSLPFAENIGVTLTVDWVKKGYDEIIVADLSGSESYVIQKIYKLKDRKQAKEIKERLRKSE